MNVHVGRRNVGRIKVSAKSDEEEKKKERGKGKNQVTQALEGNNLFYSGMNGFSVLF